MRVQSRLRVACAFIPCAVQVIGHDIEELNVVLQGRNVEMLEIPIRDREGKTQAVAATAAGVKCTLEISDEDWEVGKVFWPAAPVLCCGISVEDRQLNCSVGMGATARMGLTPSQCQLHQSCTST